MTSVNNVENQFRSAMSEKPEDRSRDSRKASKSNIEQIEPPLDKQDPTEPVKVSGSKESKGASL